ncbi:ferredoxin [Streptomyces phaeolivaceus]|uniref:Ferredoxin n=1 Tax=Streptomyces phaeolivaceus TaxID=2653200 RepID=A0A5P8KBG2_9ACTN|nr:ferredoxin [Streptomyces phaeolivaceus]QFR00472.1 ferredoxin [Streptomyces phaeolivaceus]
MRIEIDKDRCLGTGQCGVFAPDVFAQHDDDALVVVLESAPPAEFHAAVRQAVHFCPAGVITTHDH